MTTPIIPIIDTDKQELKEQYQAIIERLDQIINSPQVTTVNLNTIQQLQSAIQDIAQNQKRILKFIAKQVVN